MPDLGACSTGIPGLAGAENFPAQTQKSEAYIGCLGNVNNFANAFGACVLSVMPAARLASGVAKLAAYICVLVQTYGAALFLSLIHI